MPTPLTQEHPLRKEEWQWPEYYLYLHNHFAQFRWDIDLSSVSSRVAFFITADKSYRLYVNGTAVCRGPARGYQSHWPYDEVDIAGLLRPGKNWLSVEAYQPGCSTFQYLHQSYAGLLVATDDDLLRSAMKIGQFAMRRSPGHRRQTDRYSLQTDYQEHLDMRLDDRGWIFAAEPPTGWRAEISPPAAQQFLRMPFGRPPYDTVEPRGVPLLREANCVPALPTVFAQGISEAGYDTTPNVTWHWISEGRKIDDWRDAAELAACRTDNGLTLTVPATGIGRFTAVVIPAGEFVLGSIDCAVENAAGGEIIDLQHDQFFRDGRAHFVAPGDGCLVALGNRLILRSGANRHEFYHPLGFGAITLIARDLTQPLTVRLAIRTVGYPFEMSGGFECSDVMLNDIHSAGRRTQQLCAIDAYVDTPWREQAQWWGDARVQAWNTFYLDGDARLLARGIRSLAGQNVLGLTPGHAPTSSYWCVLPDFALTWILTLWDHYWQTGDVALFVEHYPRVCEVLAYFDTDAARHRPTGLLRHDPRLWLFEDWADLPKESVPTFLNLWYTLALRAFVRLCNLAGLSDEAKRWTNVADTTSRSIDRHCFDSTAGLLRPALRESGEPYGEPSVHDQTLALMLGMRPDHQSVFMEKALLPFLRGESVKGAKPSAFWSTYVIGEAIQRGYGEDAVAFIRRRWQPMLSTGTTWEDFAWAEESGTSACHAWSTHPCFHLVNALLGVSQSGASWKQITLVKPMSGTMKSASAVIPSPQGLIHCDWKHAAGSLRGTISVPASVEIKTTLPLTPLSRDGRIASYSCEISGV